MGRARGIQKVQCLGAAGSLCPQDQPGEASGQRWEWRMTAGTPAPPRPATGGHRDQRGAGGPGHEAGDSGEPFVQELGELHEVSASFTGDPLGRAWGLGMLTSMRNSEASESQGHATTAPSSLQVPAPSALPLLCSTGRRALPACARHPSLGEAWRFLRTPSWAPPASRTLSTKGMASMHEKKRGAGGKPSLEGGRCGGRISSSEELEAGTGRSHPC